VTILGARGVHGSTVQQVPTGSLAPAAAANLIAAGLYGAAQWSLFPLTAHYTSAAALGNLAVSIAITTPAFLVCMLYLRVVYVSDVRRVYSARSYVALRIGGLLLALLGSLAVGWSLAGDEALVVIVVVLAMFRFAEGLSDLLYGVWQSSERLVWVAVATSVRGIIAAVVFGAALALGATLTTAIAAMAGVSWCCFGAELWVAQRTGTGFGSLRATGTATQAWSLLRHAFPLGLAGGLLALGPNVPRLLLFRMTGSEEAGQFAAIQQLPLAGGMVLAAVGSAAAPRLARYFEFDRRSYRALSVRLAMVGGVTGLAMCLGALTLGRSVLTRLFGPSYAELSTTLVWLCVGSLPSFVASGIGFALTAARTFRQQIVVHGTALAVITGVGVWAISRLGILGAVIALAAGSTAGLAVALHFFGIACRQVDSR
jgi:O-antigen/teichoic acid export membrane protein